MWKQTPSNQEHNRGIWQEELEEFVPRRVFAGEAGKLLLRRAYHPVV